MQLRAEREWEYDRKYPHIWIPSRRLWTPKVLPGGIKSAITLVGGAGTVAVGAIGAGINPAWNAGASRTAGNLLILRVAHTNGAALAVPSGWTLVIDPVSATQLIGVQICYRIATGADTAPTIAGVANTILSGQLCEYAGTDASSPFLSNAGSAGGTTSPLVANCTSGDPVAGCLVIVAVGIRYSAAATKTFTDTLNNSTTQLDRSQSGAVSTTAHYDFFSGVTTSNAAADQDSFAFTTTKITGVQIGICSFSPALVLKIIQFRASSQAVQTASNW